MSQEHPEQLTPAERDGATRLVRVAQKCGKCEGEGSVMRIRTRGRCMCHNCKGTGFAPAPYQPGDVLFHQEEWRVVDMDFGTPPTAWLIDVREGDPEWRNPPVGELAYWEKIMLACGEGWQRACGMSYWASHPENRRTVVSVELVRLQEMDDDAITQWAGTDWTWPENVDTDGDYYTAQQRLESDREKCEERWDANNPDHPWASNTWGWLYEVSKP